MTYRNFVKADYYKAEQAAFYLLKIGNVSTLPIKVKKLAKHFPNLKIKKFSWFAKKWKIPFEKVCEIAGSEEGCCWYDSYLDTYLILYNDKVKSEGRKRWTIAHELGHFMLKHNGKSNRPIIARKYYTKKEYKILEQEANCFARTLLAPPPVLEKLKPTGPNFIEDLFELSNEAAVNVYNFFVNGYYMGRRYTDSFINHLFKNFIYRYQYCKTCRNCYHTFILESGDFCPVCGESNFIKGEVANMIYSKIEINSVLGLPDKCPRCSNEHVYGEYCHICGSYMINKCTGFSNGDYEDYPDNISWHNHNKGCGIQLEGDARFCTSCGSTSTFYEDGHLLSWEEEQKSKEKKVQNNPFADSEDPFANSEDPFTAPTERQLVTPAGGILTHSRDDGLPF